MIQENTIYASRAQVLIVFNLKHCVYTAFAMMMSICYWTHLKIYFVLEFKSKSMVGWYGAMK